MSKIARLRLAFHIEQLDERMLLRECSQLFHQRVHAELSQLIKRLAKRISQPRSIERLTIDLGRLNAADWPNQWRTCLLQRVERALIDELARAKQSKPDRLLELAQRVDVDKQETSAVWRSFTRDVDSAVREEAQDLFDVWIRWLHTGVWIAPVLWQAVGPDTWLCAALRKMPLSVMPCHAVDYAAQVAAACLQEPILRRLRRTFGRTTLITLAAWLTDDTSTIGYAKARIHEGGSTEQTIQPADAMPGGQRHANASGGADEGLPWAALAYFQTHTTVPVPPVTGNAATATHTARFHLRALLEAHPVLRPQVRRWVVQLCATPALYDIWAAYEARYLEPATPGFATRTEAPNEKIPARQPAAWVNASNEKIPARGAPHAVSAKLTDWRERAVSSPTALYRVNHALTTGALPVLSAGLVLLWPLLPGLFRELALLSADRFIDADAPLIAAGWLDELAWGDDTVVEWRLPVNKLLCGVPLDAVLPDWLPDPAVRVWLNNWLTALPACLPGLHRCGVTDVRQLFLQRSGTLIYRPDERWTLRIEPHAADVLLRDIPWPLEQVWLPWLTVPITVEWCR